MIIVLNNKCNLILDEYLKYQEELQQIQSNNELILCPSDIYLSKFDLNNFKLGSQNVSSYKTGAFTGEASAKQLKSIGVEYSIVGHSERRNYQKETNTDINKKIKELISHNIIPILCIGETKEDKDSNKTNNIVMNELNECLLNVEDKSKIIIAYEPIWSIGTGIIPTKKEIDDVLKKIKEIYPNNKTIYGGSINSINVEILRNSRYIDGFLIGGLSLRTKELKEFINKLN